MSDECVRVVALITRETHDNDVYWRLWHLSQRPQTGGRRCRESMCQVAD